MKYKMKKKIKKNNIILIDCPICNEPEYIILDGNYTVLYKECKNSKSNEKYHLQIEKNFLGYSIKTSFFSKVSGSFQFMKISYRKPTIEERRFIYEEIKNSRFLL